MIVLSLDLYFIDSIEYVEINGLQYSTIIDYLNICKVVICFLLQPSVSNSKKRKSLPFSIRDPLPLWTVMVW